jgi:hypothetical protein
MINYEVRGCQFELNNGRIGKMMMMDQEGQVLRSGRVPNLRAEIETGRSSYAMVDVLEEMGVAVKIAHPNEVKAIVRAKIEFSRGMGSPAAGSESTLPFMK